MTPPARVTCNGAHRFGFATEPSLRKRCDVKSSHLYRPVFRVVGSIALVGRPA